MKKTKWAIIGATGMIGRKAVPEIAAARNCKLAAIQGLCEPEVRPLAERHGVPWYMSAETMIAKTDCDIVYIASPQDAHVAHVELAAGRGRHVLCEKPLARNGREARDMVAACERAGVKMGTAFNLRFCNVHMQARAVVAAGTIGTVVSARCQYGQNYPPDPKAFRQVAEKAGGGSMVDMGNHAMDLVEFVTGKRFTRVMAVTQNVVHQYPVEDTCGALLEFEDGGLACVDTYYCVPLSLLRNDLEINGSQGVLYTVDSLRGMTAGGKLVVITAAGKTEYAFDGYDMYRREFEAFAQAVLDDAPPPCDGRDGLHSQLILDAVYASARTGKKVAIHGGKI